MMPPSSLDLGPMVHQLRSRLRDTPHIERVGKVAQVTGLVIESDGPSVGIGEVCHIGNRGPGAGTYAEVVGFRDHRVLLMPLGELHDVSAGCDVVASAYTSSAPIGPRLIGRVIDGLGQPIDGLGSLSAEYARTLRNSPPNPLKRMRITEPFETGIKVLDLFTPIGRGQRVGIFAGSGVGKSTLLGMMARGADSDVNVIALVGERGRELREFIEKDLGESGMARSVVVVATSDQPALVRIRAALLATTIAEFFRDEGRRVLLMMDSVTRLAMAQREIGLAIGEPPSSRGYTPSVFSLLPRILERAGNGETGSITAFYTVLVEGDDMNEPIADAVRGILDGHIVLSRALATANQFPAVDVLESISRVVQDVSTLAERETAGRARDLLALYRKNEDLISIGAYVRKTNPTIDRAIDKNEPIRSFLRQPVGEKVTRQASYERLAEILR
jgi:flagellum-specific ATP synthase